MSEVQRALTKYIGAFRNRLAACKTRDECAAMWRVEERARDELCIVPASYTYSNLHAEWVARGRELAEKERVAP